MRLIALLLVLLGSMGSRSFMGFVEAQNTALQSIFDELSIINRIINAVALQNSAIKRSLTARSVIIELLEVKPDEFSDLMKQDSKTVLDAVEKYGPTSTSLSVTSTPFANQDVNNWIQKGMETLGTLKAVLELRLQDSVDFAKFNLDDVTICSQKVLQPISEFYTAKKDPMVGLWTNFKSSIKEVNSCLKTFKRKLDNWPSNQGLLEALKQLENVESLTKWLEDHLEAKKKFPDFERSLTQLSRDYAQMKGHIKDHNISPLFKTILDTQEKVTDPNHHTHEHLTSGFQHGAADISRVVDDVKSPWFKEKISRGKDVEFLAKALTPIANSARSMETLAEDWKAIFKLYSEQKAIVLEALEALEHIEKFQKTPVPQGFLETIKTAFLACKTVPGATGANSDPLRASLESVYSKPKLLILETQKIRGILKQVTEKFEIPVLTTALETLKTEIPDNLSAKTVKTQDTRIRALEAFHLSEPIFKELHDLYQAELQVKSLFDQLKVANLDLKPFKDLQTLTNTAKVEETFKCFKDKKFESNGLRNTIDFVDSVLKLSEPMHYNISKTYLTLISKFQGDLKVQETNMKALGDKRRVRRDSKSQNPVLQLNDSLGLAHHLGEGMEVLNIMLKVQTNTSTLQEPATYSAEVLSEIRAKDKSEFWLTPRKFIDPVIAGIEKLERSIPNLRASKDLMTIRRVLHDAESVPGIPKFKEIFEKVPGYLRSRGTKATFQSATNNANELKTWDLDFAKHKQALSAAYLSLESVSWYFDDIFGFKKDPIKSGDNVTVINHHISYWAVGGMCVGFFLLCAFVGFVGYGCTKNGRRKYKNCWLYYFPNQEEFERRWRYSLFMDRLDGKNALVDASREVNPINTANILKKGAYVNVYSLHGNTPLHMATKRAYPEIVELLIKNGADRTLLNAQNKTAEQMIPENFREKRKEKIAKYEKIEAIYEKYRTKKFRIQVPGEFPSHLFHVYIEPRTADSVTNEFMDKFRAISTDEPLPTTTHCVVKTSEDGILETDSMDLLAWIFYGTIIVKESWMSDCLKNEKLINQDSKYLVEHVKYNGKFYENSVLPWSRSMAKGAMPYLYGAYVVVVIPGYQMMETISALINTLGGTLLTTFPSKDTFNLGSHPYLHMNLGPIFVIHDGNVNLSAYRDDPDKMFTLFTEEEFIGFLLKRDIQQDGSDHPIPVLPEDE